MLEGVMLLWFLLTAAALLFVAVDIRTTPESPLLKWGFMLLTAYTGVVGAFLYVLGCREPLPGLHEQARGRGRRNVSAQRRHRGDHTRHQEIHRQQLRDERARQSALVGAAGPLMTLLSFVALATGIAIALLARP
jgi:hypothetical protein